MIKYIKEDTSVVFSEIPDEITLCINISNCQNNCIGCHSPYLKDDIGTELTQNELDSIIKSNTGITCVCFMGEGNDKEALNKNILYIRETYPDLKIALYSGRIKVDEKFYWDNLDYIKIGPYIKDRGPLNDPNTNQALYSKGKHMHKMSAYPDSWYDITDKFWIKK